MFGKPPQPPSAPAAPDAAEQARIEGGGLVQIIVTELAPLTYYLFLNEKYVPDVEIESLSVALEAPEPNSGDRPIVRATLARHVMAVSGQPSVQRTELFPCTLEVVAVGRRLSITCMNVDSLDGAWINLGLKADGTSDEVSGARKLSVLLSDGLLDARITWDDGTTQNLLPQS